MDKFVEFAPVIIVIVMFLWQHRVFVTPEQLEKKHREIMADVEAHYVALNAYKEFREQVIKALEKVNSNVEELKEYLINKEINKKEE